MVPADRRHRIRRGARGHRRGSQGWSVLPPGVHHLHGGAGGELPDQRAEELHAKGEQLSARTKQLASLQVGVLSAIMHTLDLRDRMTARHCAAVARYAREIAIAAGFSKREQELVHTAGLLHDIGKFIFPDRILKHDTKLTEEDWQIIRMHPYQGSRVVRQMEGYV